MCQALYQVGTWINNTGSMLFRILESGGKSQAREAMITWCYDKGCGRSTHVEMGTRRGTWSDVQSHCSSFTHSYKTVRAEHGAGRSAADSLLQLFRLSEYWNTPVPVGEWLPCLFCPRCPSCVQQTQQRQSRGLKVGSSTLAWGHKDW